MKCPDYNSLRVIAERLKQKYSAWKIFKNLLAAGDCLLMTRKYGHMRKIAIISREIRNLIINFLKHKFSKRHTVLTLYRMVFFGAAHGWRRGAGQKGRPP